MNPLWALAWRNLARNKRRNTATAVAIALGFAAMLALGGYLNRVHNHLRVYTLYMNRTGHIVIYKKGGLERFGVKPNAFSLTSEEQAAISDLATSMPNVTMHGGLLTGMGLIGNGCRTLPFFATGIEPELDRRLKATGELRAWVDTGKFLRRGKGIWDYPDELGAIGVASGLARLLQKAKVHDEFPADAKAVVVADCQAPDAKDKIRADANVQLAAGTFEGMMSALDGEVVNQFDPGVTELNNMGVVTSLRHLQQLYETDHVTSWSLWLKDPSRLEDDIALIRNVMADRQLQVDIYPWNDESISPFYTGTISFLKTMISFLAFILSTVVVFSVFNAVTMTVIERGQEIGMMRSLGYTRQTIRTLFLREAFALATLSLIIGAIIGTAFISAVNAAQITLHPPGVAGGLILLLVPGLPTIIGAVILIHLLSLGATTLAVRALDGRRITDLLMGSHR